MSLEKTQLQFLNPSPEDAPKIVDLVNSCYRGDASRQGWTTEAELLGGQRTDLDAILDLIRLQRLRIGNLNGELCIAFEFQKRGDQFYFGMFSVSPTKQNMGLGKRVLSEIESMARTLGCLEIEISVILQRKELIHWYERHGYQDTKLRQPFPYGDERFGLPKVKDLAFGVWRKPLL